MTISLRFLCVLGVSAVKMLPIRNRRDAEDAEEAQRRVSKKAQRGGATTKLGYSQYRHAVASGPLSPRTVWAVTDPTLSLTVSKHVLRI